MAKLYLDSHLTNSLFIHFYPVHWYYCKTGKFRDRKISQNGGIGSFANFWIAEVNTTFLRQEMFANLPNREIFLHSKISCFTVYQDPPWSKILLQSLALKSLTLEGWYLPKKNPCMVCYGLRQPQQHILLVTKQRHQRDCKIILIGDSWVYPYTSAILIRE